ncbi:MAG: hypothetical protein ABIF04_02595 [Chloroflexota bacterium]
MVIENRHVVRMALFARGIQTFYHHFENFKALFVESAQERDAVNYCHRNFGGLSDSFYEPGWVMSNTHVAISSA